MCIGLLPACICTTFVCLVPSEGVESPDTRVTYSCELPCGCREWNIVLWKRCQFSYSLSHLFSLPLFIFLKVCTILLIF